MVKATRDPKTSLLGSICARPERLLARRSHDRIRPLRPARAQIDRQGAQDEDGGRAGSGRARWDSLRFVLRCGVLSARACTYRASSVVAGGVTASP